jgi:hypothetical protein
LSPLGWPGHGPLSIGSSNQPVQQFNLAPGLLYADTERPNSAVRRSPQPAARPHRVPSPCINLARPAALTLTHSASCVLLPIRAAALGDSASQVPLPPASCSLLSARRSLLLLPVLPVRLLPPPDAPWLPARCSLSPSSRRSFRRPATAMTQGVWGSSRSVHLMTVLPSVQMPVSLSITVLFV